jgi:1-acyl-sn-glycerol-3-phosphate acyltransferase
MQLVRSFIFFIFMVLLVLPFTLIGIIGLLFSHTTSYRLMSGYSHCIILLLKVLCNLKLEIIGQENIQAEGVIYMAKHQSAWETLTMQCILPPNSSWIIKKSLVYVPVFGLAVLAADPIAIDRKNRKGALDSIIKQGKKKISIGRNIIVFPEGTRTAYGENTRYKQGAAKLAIATEATVIPVAHNAGKYWKRRGIKKFPGTIRLEIGSPISSKGRDPGELTDEVKDWIESRLKAWDELPD